MLQTSITATFSDREEAERALGSLRLAGALCHTPTLPRGGSAGRATLHLTVRQRDASLARTLLREAGGQL